MRKTYQVSYRVKYNKNQISRPYFCFARADTFMQAVNQVVKRYSDHTTDHIIIDSCI